MRRILDLTAAGAPRLRWLGPALLLALWLGRDPAARLALLLLSVLLPVILQTVRGIRAADPALVETGRSHDLCGWPLYRHVLLPGALPYLLTGLRQGLGLLWLTLIALELFVTPSGLGLPMRLASGSPDAVALLLGIASFVALNAASGALTGLLERWLLRWRPR